MTDSQQICTNIIRDDFWSDEQNSEEVVSMKMKNQRILSETGDGKYPFFIVLFPLIRVTNINQAGTVLCLFFS